MVRQLTICACALLAVTAWATDYIVATGEDGTETVYTDDRMVLGQWHDDALLWMPFPSGTAGTYYDYSKGQRDGEQPTGSKQPTWTDGYYIFNTNTVILVDDAGLEFGDGDTDVPFSIALWMRKDTDAYAGLISMGSLDVEYALRVNTSLQVGFFLYSRGAANNRYSCTSANGVISTNTWTHLAATYGAAGHASMAVFKNGVDISDASSETGSYIAMTNTGSDLTIGAMFVDVSSIVQRFIGAIDDVRIYNRALNSNEVNTIYQDTKWRY